MASLDPSERDAVIEAAEIGAPRRWRDDETVQDATCPACGHTARVEDEIDLEFVPDWDVADGEPYVAGTAYFVADRVACPICKLHPDGADELAAVGEMETRWELRPANEDEYREYYTDDA